MSLIIQSRLVLWESSSTIQNYSEQQLPLILLLVLTWYIWLPSFSLNNMSMLHLNPMHFLFCTLLSSNKKSASAPTSLVATEKYIQREQLYSCLILSGHGHCRNQSKFQNIFEERDHTASLFTPLAVFHCTTQHAKVKLQN